MEKDFKKMFTEYWKYLVIKTAAKLNIFDIIHKNSFTVNDLSVNMKLDNDVLSDLIIALVEERLIKLNNNILTLTDNGLIFTENYPKSLKYAAIHWGEEHLTAWQHLEYTLKTGKPAFEYIFKKPLFKYLSENPDRLEYYHKAMNEYARDDYAKICNYIDFSVYESVMDVGGGLGALIQIISKNYPDIKCFLFDKPEVIKLACLDRKIKKIGGDFFIEIPQVAETIILSRVIHDWDNENAKTILSNVYKALPENGTLFLIENLTDKIPDKAALLSLNMHLVTKSFERTREQYTSLLKQTGFELTNIIQINNLQYALKFVKI